MLEKESIYCLIKILFMKFGKISGKAEYDENGKLKNLLLQILSWEEVKLMEGM